MILDWSLIGYCLRRANGSPMFSQWFPMVSSWCHTGPKFFPNGIHIIEWGAWSVIAAPRAPGTKGFLVPWSLFVLPLPMAPQLFPNCIPIIEWCAWSVIAGPRTPWIKGILVPWSPLCCHSPSDSLWFPNHRVVRMVCDCCTQDARD